MTDFLQLVEKTKLPQGPAESLEGYVYGQQTQGEGTAKKQYALQQRKAPPACNTHLS